MFFLHFFGNLFVGSIMKPPDTKLKIHTLGRFSISIDGRPVATDWPDESTKLLFCSLLSPLDLYFSWDRICRSLCGEPETVASRHRLEKDIIHPLNSYLSHELGFNPLRTGQEGIRIDQQSVHVDAFEFHSAVIDGLNQYSQGNHPAAHEKFSRAHLLYGGSYLPGLPGKIITSTRTDLESLYRAVVLNVLPLTCKSDFSACATN